MSERNMNPIEQFEAERQQRINQQGADQALRALSSEWLETTMRQQYVYNFEWLGRPIIQYPQDMVAVQELIWKVRPDVVVETGIAHGGSLILSASILAMLDLCDATQNGELLDPRQPKRKVIGVDIDIRAHNRDAIEAHPLANRIEMIQGSSIAPETVQQVRNAIPGGAKVMVFLDSMHTHDHVVGELDAYGVLTSPGSYCVVFDSFVEDMPPKFFADRPWDVGNNPRTAIRQWLPAHADFEVDTALENKLLVTVAPGGFLRRKT
jgi:cephalosporin hydroxylase